MPIYEYECRDCGFRFEVVQAISSAPLTTCTSCKKEGLYRLISPPGLSFKGEGWYITDYARKGKETGTKKAGEKVSEKNKETAVSAATEKSPATEKKEVPSSRPASDAKTSDKSPPDKKSA